MYIEPDKDTKNGFVAAVNIVSLFELPKIPKQKWMCGGRERNREEKANRRKWIKEF